MKIDEHTPEKRLDEMLRQRYGFGLAPLKNSFQDVRTTYRLIDFRRMARELEDACKELETLRTGLLGKLTRFLKKSGGWQRIQKKGDIDKRGGENKVIEEEFLLGGYFKRVDEEIAGVRRRIRLIQAVKLQTAEMRKRVQAHTMLVLVWLRALKPKSRTLTELYEDVYSLLVWFLVNRKRMLDSFKKQMLDDHRYRADADMAKGLATLDVSAIRRDYERYIQSPTENMKIYSELTDTIYSDSFQPPKDDDIHVILRNIIYKMDLPIAGVDGDTLFKIMSVAAIKLGFASFKSEFKNSKSLCRRLASIKGELKDEFEVDIKPGRANLLIYSFSKKAEVKGG